MIKNSLKHNLASPNDFALAFKIFDINGDGALDKEEFNKVKVNLRFVENNLPILLTFFHFIFGTSGFLKIKHEKWIVFQTCILKSTNF